MNRFTATLQMLKLVVLFPIDVVRRAKFNYNYEKWLKQHSGRRTDIY